MTNTSSTVRRAGAVGVVGEYLAAECLRELGWAVDDDVFGRSAPALPTASGLAGPGGWRRCR